MHLKGMALDCGCDYERAVIYKFITEELFEHEMDNISVSGMVTHFIYEEFHPNHEQDLKRYTDELVGILFRKRWDRFDSHCFAQEGSIQGSGIQQRRDRSNRQNLQEAHRAFQVEQFEFQDLSFDMDKQQAEVHGLIRYTALGNGNRTHGGTCKVNFAFQWGFWYISGFRFPGFGD